MQNRVVWANDETIEEYVYNECSQLLHDSESEVYVFAYEVGSHTLRYQDFFVLDASQIGAIVFSEQLIGSCGGLNKELPVGHLYEFLGRLLWETKECRILPLQLPKTESAGLEENAFLYAYTMRYHMGYLRQLQVLDKVFVNVCNRMQLCSGFSLFQQYFDTFLSDEGLFHSIASITSPFLILRGDDTCNGVLQGFADDLADSLQRLGQSVIVAGDNPEVYDQLSNGIYKGIVGFQTRALEIDFFRKLRGPKFQFWLDHPLQFTDVLRNLPSEYYILCQDSVSAGQIQRFYHTENALQFPPGGVNADIEPDFSSERLYDIVFIGSYFADDSRSLSEKQSKFYEFMINNCLLDFEQGLCAFLDIPPGKNVTVQFESEMRAMQPACRCVIGYFRNKVVKSILSAGYDIHVYGEEWKCFDTSGLAGKLLIHPVVTVSESLEELKKAKIGLNVMSWHKGGMTERIANIMLSGAVCLSDETTFLREHMDKEEMAIFSLQEIDMLPDTVHELLGDADRRMNMAKKAYMKAKENYSWEARAGELIQLAEQAWTEISNNRS